jgi:hypothetical protein
MTPAGDVSRETSGRALVLLLPSWRLIRACYSCRCFRDKWLIGKEISASGARPPRTLQKSPVFPC